MYVGDLKEFISESKFEDYCNSNDNAILVSTIHKSKGREFDTVYMLLNNVECVTDEDKRKLYVGITRAKKNLFIHTNNDIFKNISLDGIDKAVDNNRYDIPSSIVLQLSYKDVVLDFFKDKQNIIKNIQSGDELFVEFPKMYVERKGEKISVVKFSKDLRKELSELCCNGYDITNIKAKTRFSVLWKPKGENDEVNIILPDLTLLKKERDILF